MATTLAMLESKATTAEKLILMLRQQIGEVRAAQVIMSAAGPSGINNFNPGIFGTGFCKNPGIPGFSGSGLASISNPGIV